MENLFLAATAVGLVLLLVARRPVRGPLLAVPSFFVSWLVTELAPQLLLTHVVAVAVLAVLSDAGTWQFWTAVALAVTVAYQLVSMIGQARRVNDVLDEALDAVTGPGDVDTSIPWRRLVFPFLMHNPEVRRSKNIAYSEGGRRYLLDVWQPVAPGEGRPCLIQIHGSAWTVSNKDQQGKPVCIEMASRGWICFAINYPLSPRATHPDHIVGVKRAIAWVREHAHTYGGDPRFVLVTGGSAGGHLAALAALSPGEAAFQPGFEDADTSVQAVVPIYGVYDLTGSLPGAHRRSLRRMLRGRVRFLERAVLKRRLDEHRDVFESASPLFRIGPHAPPFFVVHGSHDTLASVEEARHFVETLRSSSSEPVAYAELPGTAHAFDVFTSVRSVHTMRAIARFAEWSHERWATRLQARGEG